MFNEEGNYFPIVYFEEFWMLRDKLVPMNDTVAEVSLVLRIKSLSFWWMQVGAVWMPLFCLTAT